MSFPSKENPTLCKNGCGAKIYLSKKGNRYLPYDVTTEQLHDCPKRPKDKDGWITEQKQEFTVDAVIKKLASIGIIIDLDRLMKE